MRSAILDEGKKGALLFWGVALTLWGLVTIALILGIVQDNQIPVDASTYFEALEDFAGGLAPYDSVTANQAIWRGYHTLEAQVLADVPRDEIRTDLAVPGPFIYPPTLLQIMDLLKITPAAFMLWLLASLILFAWLWLKVTHLPASWLLLVVLSWDFLASFLGGNVEIILLSLALLGAYLLHGRRPIWSAPLIAFVVIVKPFYALFFVAFGVFLLANSGGKRKENLRSLLMSAAVTAAFLVSSVLLWPEWLRPLVFGYLREGLAHTWYVLPLAEQTPMSLWNRTFMQGVVNLGVAASTAQVLSLVAWSLATAVTAIQIARRELPFPVLFALGFLLLYWFRPVGWGLIFLDIVVLSAVWSLFSAAEKKWLLGGAVLLASSHWVAIVLTASQYWARFFTVQSATFPFETWLVFPICWAILLVGVRRSQFDESSPGDTSG
ncbi:MAG: glycosyltransferase 87 family protein [Acidobacteriota bacterium]